MTVGVLAVQGAFIEHERVLRALGATSVELRQLSDLERPLDGLILPGGESTAQGLLLRELGMLVPLRERILGGMPVLGTCAGMILLARELSGGEEAHLRTMDITVRRNAYGRQLGSFHATAPFGGDGEIPMTFIRAPYIERAGEGVEILAVVDGHPVAARQGNQIATAFHPELTGDPTVHRLLLRRIEERRTGN